MVRQIDPKETFEDLYDEVDYTTVRLEDEPDARPLAAKTTAWTEAIQATEKDARAFRREATSVQAKLDGANQQLDVATEAFGDKLYLAVDKDRKSARWRGSFRDTVSEFKRQPLSDQTRGVRGWLDSSGEPVVAEERGSLEPAAARAQAALALDAGLDTKRGNVWAAREKLAAYLTNERDALEDELAAIGRNKGHDRFWARSFFRATRRRDAGGGTGGGGTPS